MEVGCELQLLSGGGRVVFITDSPLAVLLTQPPVEIGYFHWRFCYTNRQWKLDFHWRLFYTNRQWKYLISTGGCIKITASGNRFPLAVPKPGPPGFFTGAR
jgi:hypothetical protein